MIDATIKIEFRPERITRAVDKAAFKNIGHAAATIRKMAANSIKEREGASIPGTPPHTHSAGTKLVGSGSRGRALKRDILKGTAKVVRFKGRLPRSIAYDIDRKKNDAIIGPKGSTIDDIGRLHEFGGVYMGGVFPARPFMAPALEANIGRFADSWQGSVGE